MEAAIQRPADCEQRESHAAKLTMLGKLAGDTLRYGFFSALAKTVHLLLLPVLTRQFTPAEYGVIDLTATLVALITTAIVVDLNGALARYHALYRESGKSIYASLLTFVAGWGAIVVGVALLSRPFVIELLPNHTAAIDVLFIAVGIAYVGSLNQIGDMLLRMENRIMVFNLLSGLEAMAFLALSIGGVVYFDQGVRWVFIAQLIAALAHTLALGPLTKRALAGGFDFGIVKRSLSFSLPMFPATLVGWLNSQTSRIILLSVIGATAVGVYGVGARLAGTVGFLMMTFQMAWLPFSMTIVNEKASLRNDVYSAVLKYFLAGFLSLSLLLTAVATDLIAIIATEQYVRTALILPWLLGAAVVHQCANIANIGSLVSEKTGVNTTAAAIALMLNVVASLALIRMLGFAGAALGTFLAEVVFVSILYARTQRSNVASFDTTAITLTLLTYVAVSALLLLLTPVSSSPSPLIYRLVVALVGVGVMALLVVRGRHRAGLAFRVS